MRSLSSASEGNFAGCQEAEKHGLSRIARNFYLLIFVLCICGGVYIYEINTLATKGYEIREMENKIEQLAQEGRQLKIRETELKSMYVIEKSTKDLNLVSSSNVSYVELDGPVAMK